MVVFNLFRETSNCLYTHGVLNIGKKLIAETLEDSFSMPPVGVYELSTCKICKGEYRIELDNTEWSIGAVNSYKDCRKQRKIGVGQILIPGAMFKSKDDFQTLVEEIQRQHRLHKKVELLITDTYCRRTTPIKHWT